MINLKACTKNELLAELDRREAARRADVCDYCGQPFATEPCAYPERHTRMGPMPFPPDAIARIKEVREATRAGLAEAKAACERAEWDVEEAIRRLGGRV